MSSQSKPQTSLDVPFECWIQDSVAIRLGFPCREIDTHSLHKNNRAGIMCPCCSCPCNPSLKIRTPMQPFLLIGFKLDTLTNAGNGINSMIRTNVATTLLLW